MKIAISYFYQIRNFKKNMIPVSMRVGIQNGFIIFKVVLSLF